MWHKMLKSCEPLNLKYNIALMFTSSWLPFFCMWRCLLLMQVNFLPLTNLYSTLNTFLWAQKCDQLLFRYSRNSLNQLFKKGWRPFLSCSFSSVNICFFSHHQITVKRMSRCGEPQLGQNKQYEDVTLGSGKYWWVLFYLFSEVLINKISVSCSPTLSSTTARWPCLCVYCYHVLFLGSVPLKDYIILFAPFFLLHHISHCSAFSAQRQLVNSPVYNTATSWWTIPWLRLKAYLVWLYHISPTRSQSLSADYSFYYHMTMSKFFYQW